MRQLTKKLIRLLARRAGFEIVRYHQKILGVDPFSDVQHFLSGIAEPTILDVGANLGQSVDRFIPRFPGSRVHSFEPSPSTYEKLAAHCECHPNVTPWNLGVGSSNGMLEFVENQYSDMSSFLEPGKFCWGEVAKRTNVEVKTLDTFAKDQGIEFIHLLKSDTQGFDFEVFKGARELMDENRIALIYFELIFSDMYENLPPFDQVFRYLMDKGFLLVSFYDFHFQRDLASWTDALFISREFYLNLNRVDACRKQLDPPPRNSGRLNAGS